MSISSYTKAVLLWSGPLSYTLTVLVSQIGGLSFY
jgi:hypothetical protein